MAKTGKTINNVIRGDTRQVNLTFLESDGSTPIDLTGGTVYFTVNSSSDPSDDTAAVIAKSATTFLDEDGATIAGTLGKHTFTLSHSDTNIEAAPYWYDSQLVDSVGGYLSGYRGKFIVQSDIKRG